jgi:hypothetical protein
MEKRAEDENLGFWTWTVTVQVGGGGVCAATGKMLGQHDCIYSSCGCSKGLTPNGEMLGHIAGLTHPCSFLST